MKVALIISTYNSPEKLNLCLKSVQQQDLLPDEILIADDGSDRRTKQLIDYHRSLMEVPLIHVWHEDKGFRKSLILNKTIAKCTADYIIQVDGDVILHPSFVRDHVDFAKPGSLVRASRIYLNRELTELKLSKDDIKVNYFEKGISNFFSQFRMPFLRKFFEKNYKVNGDEKWEIHGCNMAFWREDAIKVNGYNEDFVGWGPEDKEFVARLLNLGLEKRFLKFGAIVYHLWHKLNSRENLSLNEEIFRRTKESKVYFCANGINKYLSNC